MSEKTTVNPDVVKEARDVMRAIQISQAGKPVEGNPAAGEHQIEMRAGMTFWGDHDYVAKLMTRAFPGCTFIWKV